ncbi:MAG: hypothetical protein ACLRSJ_07395, partial [Agathobaculum sp.]
QAEGQRFEPVNFHHPKAMILLDHGFFLALWRKAPAGRRAVIPPYGAACSGLPAQPKRQRGGRAGGRCRIHAFLTEF